MDSEKLPDLSDWRYVEVWTLEEAALLWAAIDPLDHENTRINALGHDVPLTQRRKALIFQRAVAEAVCAGTLAFVDALESRESERGDAWEAEVSHPRLPNPNRLIPHKTRVNQAAFMRWVGIKKIPSYRQLVSKFGTSVVVEAPAPVPALPKPDFRDPSHPRAAIELITAIDIWEGISGHDYIDGVSPNPKRVAISAIELHPIGKELPLAAKDRISTLTNWKQKGGCNPTPGGEPTHPTQ